MEVPERRFFVRFELLQQSNDLIGAGDGSALKAETLGDARKRTTTEHRPAVIQLVGSQLMNFSAIGAVVQHADKKPPSPHVRMIGLSDLAAATPIA